MPTKSDLQDTLKAKYDINKNISQSLSAVECEELLTLLQGQASAIKLVESFIAKNEELSRNNRNFGQQRSQAQQKLKSLQADHEKLEQAIKELENSNISLVDHRERLSQEQQELEAQIQQLSAKNETLSSKVQTLTTQNDELVDANQQLKKDNKDLKNIVDQIRLRLARDTKMLLEYEDSEIRKALIRLFRWTLG
jgi:chromosome segregation ATPase